MLKFSVDKQEKYATITIEDEKLFSLNAPELKSQFVLLNNDGVRNIILNFNDLPYIDSSGLSAVLVGYRMCKEVNGSFVLTGMSDSVQKVFKIAQLDRVMSSTPTLSEAIDFVFMEEIERDIEDDGN